MVSQSHNFKSFHFRTSLRTQCDKKEVWCVGCWRWFKGVLKEAGIEVTDENREKIDEVIHEVVGETSKYERCSGDWRKVGKRIKADENEKKKLIEKLRAALA